MSELRRPPAFQVYAADELASAGYYALSLPERGLVDAIRRVIWCDDSIPADLAGIALAVRRPEGETRDALTDRVLRHFQPVEGDPSRLTCRELRRQMTRLLDQRHKQSDAADKTNNAKRDAKRDGDRDGKRDGEHDGKRDGDRDDDRHGPEQNRAEQNRAEPGSVGVPSNKAQTSKHSAVDPDLQTVARKKNGAPTKTANLTPDQTEWVDGYREAEADPALPIARSSVVSNIPGDMVPTVPPAVDSSVIGAPATMHKRAALVSDAPIQAPRPAGPEFDRARARRATVDAHALRPKRKTATGSTSRNAK
jgi:hypothetical protein